MSAFGQIRPIVGSPSDCPTSFLAYDFAVGSARLRGEHERFLRDPVARILQVAGNRLRIVGRASRAGADRANLNLSRERADAVRRFLTGLGVADRQITLEWIGERQPYSPTAESDEDRSVELHLTIEPTFTLLLTNAGLVRPTLVMIEHIRQMLEPIVLSAGRRLSIIQSLLFGGSVDTSLTFRRGATHDMFGPGAQHSALGAASIAGADVNVDLHADQRVGAGVGAGPRRVPGRPELQDYATPARTIFENDEDGFARFVANTCLHELGHVIADLPDRRDDMDDVMFSYDALGSRLPRERRTRETLREYYSRPRRFRPEDRAAMVCAIHRAYYPLQVSAVP